MSEVRTQLLRMLRTHSLQLGRFRLVSGASSNYYFDSKLTTLRPEGAYLSAKVILEEQQQGSGGLLTPATAFGNTLLPYLQREGVEWE